MGGEIDNHNLEHPELNLDDRQQLLYIVNRNIEVLKICDNDEKSQATVQSNPYSYKPKNCQVPLVWENGLQRMKSMTFFMTHRTLSFSFIRKTKISSIKFMIE